MVQFDPDAPMELFDKRDVEEMIEAAHGGLELLNRGSKVRVLRPLSASADKHVALEHTNPQAGFLFEIVIPKGFWGARDISTLSVYESEKETLFPPHSLYLVTDTDFSQRPRVVRLRAIDKYDQIEYE